MTNFYPLFSKSGNFFGFGKIGNLMGGNSNPEPPPVQPQNIKARTINFGAKKDTKNEVLSPRNKSKKNPFKK